MEKTLSLGVDVGTSKISVSVFNNQNMRWKPLLFNGKVVSSALIGISRDTAELRIGATETELVATGNVPVYSVKRCVICEWSSINVRTINENECVNKANYVNEKWCQKGNLNFTIDSMIWKPSSLFEQLISDVFSKVDLHIKNNYPNDFRIKELKVGTPMVFHKGQFYIDWLQSKILSLSNSCLGQWFTKESTIEIIEEPIAALMAYAYNRKDILPQGYFLVVDSGAGTTDIVLCEKKGERVSFIDHDSIYIAGDNYNEAMERVIENLNNGNDLLQKAKRQGVSIKDLKEEYCNRGTATLSLMPPETPRQLDNRTVEPYFMQITNTIIQKIEQCVNKWCAGKFEPQKVYITGGCFNVPSLREEIKHLCSRKGYDLQEIVVNNPDFHDDHKVLAVSMGCALPKKDYIKTVVYQLPIKVVIELKRMGENIPPSERFKKLETLYDPDDEGKCKPSGDVKLRNIDPSDNLIVAIITKKAEKRNLCEVRIRRYFVEKRIRTRFSMELKYELTFNCKLIIHSRSIHRTKWIKIYDDYIKY